MKVKRFLTKGLYEKNGSRLFFLRNEQIRAKRNTLIRNAGWYNDVGQKLGSGDLDGADLLRICSDISEYEFFIALHEDVARRFDTANPKKSKTSRANLLKDVRYLVSSQGIFSICYESRKSVFQYSVNHLTIGVVTEAEALTMIKKAQAKITWL